MIDGQTSYPYVSLSGTDAQTLMQQQRDIIDIAQALLERMIDATPHPRDYQGGEHAWRDAMGEHNMTTAAVNHFIMEAQYRLGMIEDQAQRLRA
jgi:membrane-anchored protein YejM (alkaline phosphatase superfamily)